jgi:hypothetical protein
MRKERIVTLGLVVTGVAILLAGTLLYLVNARSAGTALTICLVGLGPALAAVALVAALSAVAPPGSAQSSALSVSSAPVESTNEA